MIAEVIIDSRAKNLNRVFDYKIPKDLEDVIDVGSRVLVPFANFKALEQGYVWKTTFLKKELSLHAIWQENIFAMFQNV